MLFAFAVDEEGKMAATLGKSAFILFLSENGTREDIVPLPASLPELLKKKEVEVLFCKGIGLCSNMFLEGNNIKAVSGCVEENVQKVLADYLADTLERNRECFCSSSGRSCGECPGKF